jgi:hypothetical protein
MILDENSTGSESSRLATDIDSEDARAIRGQRITSKSKIRKVDILLLDKCGLAISISYGIDN